MQARKQNKYVHTASKPGTKCARTKKLTWPDTAVTNDATSDPLSFPSDEQWHKTHPFWRCTHNKAPKTRRTAHRCCHNDTRCAAVIHVRSHKKNCVLVLNGRSRTTQKRSLFNVQSPMRQKGRHAHAQMPRAALAPPLVSSAANAPRSAPMSRDRACTHCNGRYANILWAYTQYRLEEMCKPVRVCGCL